MDLGLPSSPLSDVTASDMSYPRRNVLTTGSTLQRMSLAITAVSLLLGLARAELSKEDLLAWNTLHPPEEDAQNLPSQQHSRRLLVSSGSCACVCAGTHQGYTSVSALLQIDSTYSQPRCSWTGDLVLSFALYAGNH